MSYTNLLTPPSGISDIPVMLTIIDIIKPQYIGPNVKTSTISVKQTIYTVFMITNMQMFFSFKLASVFSFRELPFYKSIF